MAAYFLRTLYRAGMWKQLYENILILSVCYMHFGILETD